MSSSHAMNIAQNDVRMEHTPGVNGVEQSLKEALDQVNRLVLGKHEQVRLAFACLLAGGHLLLEDLPGTGKTVLARSLAATMDMDFRRIQFTSDLMPSDIVGVSVYQAKSDTFELHQGPVFTNIVLADEINRASPRTQSALLEAMAEGQVSVDRNTLKLPSPFMVIATQNPLDLTGTYPLPSAQKDRFLFQLSMGYPDRNSEISLMRGERRVDMLDQHVPKALLSAGKIIQLRQRVKCVKLSDAILNYAYALVVATRDHDGLSVGLSPRASLSLVEAAQAVAFISGRSFVIPEDIQETFAPLAIHRVKSKGSMGHECEIVADILLKTPC